MKRSVPWLVDSRSLTSLFAFGGSASQKESTSRKCNVRVYNKYEDEGASRNLSSQENYVTQWIVASNQTIRVKVTRTLRANLRWRVKTGDK